MSRCDIRGLTEEEIVKLDRLAKHKHLSREEYLRRIIRVQMCIRDRDQAALGRKTYRIKL